MSELDDVLPGKVTIKLNGSDRVIRFGFRAWANLEKKFGGFAEMFSEFSQRPFATLPAFLAASIVPLEGEVITDELVSAWLDEYGLADLREILDTIKAAIAESMPKTENPPPAKAD